MFLVIESGSTKADWMLIEDGVETSYSTKGFNPYFHSQEDILIELNNHLDLGLIKDKVTDVFFYGAGCSSEKLNAIVENAFSLFFKNAKIYVDHDLAAAAFSCYLGKPQITCILGTGSNSCHFDGKVVSEVVPALSYILGDEGSGCHFGKAMLADFLYHRLPDAMNKELIAMGVDKTSINEHVYMKPNANVYIASFMPVLVRNKDLEYSQDLIRKNFQEFIDVHVKCFADFQNVDVNFIGSVACLLQDELRAVCQANGIKVGMIIRRPLDNLVSYHKNKLDLAIG
jgi:glucosamine kinase